MTKIDYKYSEDKILADVKQYIDKTYGQHYKSEDQDIQCLDAWIAMGDATPTFRNTAIKYLWRYGKKNGSNKDDLDRKSTRLNSSHSSVSRMPSSA